MMPFNVVSLIAAADAGETFTYRLFWGHRARAGGKPTEACFSQWWPSRFEIDGRVYTTAEQWMMSSKARLFGDLEAEERILSTHEPEHIKAIGRSVTGFVQQSWDENCFDIVTVGNVAKFGQDAKLKTYLLETGDDVLVEASPVDVVWGVGLARDAPGIYDPRAWRGENMLGFAIMRARAVIRGDIEPVNAPWGLQS